jgi:outer membrane protein assembly factor BamD (BamD/ComL family)
LTVQAGFDIKIWANRPLIPFSNQGAIMAAKKVTRKELLKSSDEFITLSSRAFGFFAAHVRQLKIAGLIVLALLVCYLGGYAYIRYVNQKGQAAYDEAFYLLHDSADPEQYRENLKKAVEIFQGVIESHGWSNAAELAIPQVAYGKFMNSEYDQSIKLYSEFKKEASGDPDFGTLSVLAIAACYEAGGDFKKAVDALKGVVDGPDSPFKENATYNLGRVYRLDHQAEQAQAALKSFIEKYPSSPLVPMAKAHLEG